MSVEQGGMMNSKAMKKMMGSKDMKKMMGGKDMKNMMKGCMDMMAMMSMMQGEGMGGMMGGDKPPRTNKLGRLQVNSPLQVTLIKSAVRQEQSLFPACLPLKGTTMNALKMCLNWKVIAGLAAVGSGFSSSCPV
jgi:hypothetical protein